MRVCVPEGSESVRVKVGEHDEEEGEAKGKGKGKGKIIAGEERSDKEQPQTNAEPKEEHSPAFPVTALGGTFDHLHAGHKILLTMAASITTRKLIVGVTGSSSLSLSALGSARLADPVREHEYRPTPPHQQKISHLPRIPPASN